MQHIEAIPILSVMYDQNLDGFHYSLTTHFPLFITSHGGIGNLELKREAINDSVYQASKTKNDCLQWQSGTNPET